MSDRTTPPAGFSPCRVLLKEGIAQGLHIGAQLYVSRDTAVQCDLAVGESRPGVEMTPDSLMLWLSATKPIAAAAIMQLVEHGLCALDEPVHRYIPEFAAGGKEAVTIRHLLTHTCGFRWVDIGGPTTPWEEIIARVCAARLERGWIPGERAGYHTQASWFVLGELVWRIDGRTFSTYVRDEIFGPLGMNDSWVGMPPGRFAAYGLRIGQMQLMDKLPPETLPLSSEAGLVQGSPGAGGCGPMHELGRFYEMLLGSGERAGVRILSPESVRAMTCRQRVGMFDETFRHTMDWGLGLIIDSKQYGANVPYGYGPHASSESFGHSGNQSSVAFADPAVGLVVALVFNGLPGEPKHQARVRAVLAAVYEDLDLA